LRLSYHRAKELLGEIKGVPIDKRPYGLELHHLALALQSQGFHVVADWDRPKRFKPGTIVCVGVEGGRVDQEHYVVRTADDMWMDPWINYPVKPNRKAGLSIDFPKSKEFFVALVPKRGSQPR